MFTTKQEAEFEAFRRFYEYASTAKQLNKLDVVVYDFEKPIRFTIKYQGAPLTPEDKRNFIDAPTHWTDALRCTAGFEENFMECIVEYISHKYIDDSPVDVKVFNIKY